MVIFLEKTLNSIFIVGSNEMILRFANIFLTHTQFETSFTCQNNISTFIREYTEFYLNIDILIIDDRVIVGRYIKQFKNMLKLKSSLIFIYTSNENNNSIEDKYTNLNITVLDKINSDNVIYNQIINAIKDRYIKSKIYSFDEKNIIYIEKYKDQSIFHLSSGNNFKIYESLKNIYMKLDNKKFVFTDKGIIVNLFHIKEIQKENIRLDNGSTVPISRRRYNDVCKKYKEYLLYGKD